MLAMRNRFEEQMAGLREEAFRAENPGDLSVEDTLLRLDAGTFGVCETCIANSIRRFASSLYETEPVMSEIC